MAVNTKAYLEAYLKIRGKDGRLLPLRLNGPQQKLYAALAAVWAWPYADEVVTTITAVDTFLGAVLCISTAQYHKDNKLEV